MLLPSKTKFIVFLLWFKVWINLEVTCGHTGSDSANFLPVPFSPGVGISELASELMKHNQLIL